MLLCERCGGEGLCWGWGWGGGGGGGGGGGLGRYEGGIRVFGVRGSVGM